MVILVRRPNDESQDFLIPGRGSTRGSVPRIQRRLLIKMAAALPLLTMSRIALAADEVPPNGNFEADNLSGWRVTGDAAVVTDALDSYTQQAMHSVPEG